MKIIRLFLGLYRFIKIMQNKINFLSLLSQAVAYLQACREKFNLLGKSDVTHHHFWVQTFYQNNKQC